MEFTDLAGRGGRSLRIERAISAGEFATPKSGHGGTITLGVDAAALWQSLHATLAE